ncbi:MAG: pilus assembly protein TadG-related protein [Anaerolineae bacterium]|jgi:hypothetical protein
MGKKILNTESGQAVVVVAAAIVVLLALAGLAIDGGTVYVNRRRMQNASDAAALAGTRLLAEAICGDGSVNDAAIAAAVLDYAVRNGVDGDDAMDAYYVTSEDNTVVQFDPPEPVGDGEIPDGAVGVVVTTAITRPTYFMGLVGQPMGTAAADATAITGNMVAGGGMRPFGVPEEILDELGPGGSFTLDFSNCQEEDGCTVSWTGGNAQHRGWLNIGYVWNQDENDHWPRALYPNAGKNLLIMWMENGLDVTLHSDDCGWEECGWGDWAQAVPGAAASVLPHAQVPMNNDEIIFVPVFDATVPYEDIPSSKAPEAPGGGSFYYHIIGFTAVKVTGYDQGGKTLTLELVEQIGTGQTCPPADALEEGYGGSGCRFNMQVVSLWH